LPFCLGCPCLKIESCKVEHKAMDCSFDKWRVMKAGNKGMSLTSRDLGEDTRNNIVQIRGMIVSECC